MIFDLLTRAVFLERLNRFTVLVDLHGEPVQAHLPNSGRLRELLTPGRTAYLLKKDEPWRKTKFDMAVVGLGNILVSVNARLPSDLVEEALKEKGLAPFRKYGRFRREVVFGESRLDFKLENSSVCLLEVKSVTKVSNGVAMFPDAVTARGSRHVRTLLAAKDSGMEAAVAFIVQREDAEKFSPDDETDPRFGDTLRDAVAKGVKAFAFKCKVTLEEIRITEQIPVVL